MGLHKALTTPWGIGTSVFRWSEPLWYRLRLRGDLWLRVFVMLGAWAGATGIFLGLFAFNVDPPGILLAIGLGAGFGLGPAFLLTTMLRDHVGGRVKFRDNDFYMQRQYISMSLLAGGWIEYGDWPYSTIEKCVIVPGQRINKSFSVMLLFIGSGTMILGIPQKIELKKLAGFLSSKGVTVSPGQSVPSACRKPLNLFVGLSIPALAMLLFLVGSTCYLVRVGLAGGEGNNQLAQPEEFRALQDAANRPPELATMPGGLRESFPASRPSSVDTPEQPTFDDDIPGPSTPSLGPGLGFGGSRLGPPSDEPANSGAETAPDSISSPDQPVPDGSSTPQTPQDPLPTVEITDTILPGSDGRTETVGGSGGGPFETTDEQRRPVIGVRSRLGFWGRERVARLEPLFAPASPAARETVELARDGYAIGALDVSSSDYVDAVRPVFMRRTADGRLDADESYEGNWIGSPAEQVTRLTAAGAEVIGFHGRGRAVLDALGLVVRGDD